MKIDIKKYIGLRDSLLREKAELQQRLQEINQALGTQEAELGSAARAVASPKASAGKRGRPASSGLSLREAVLQLTAKQPMSKQEILNGVKELGYRFSTSNPANSLGVILYGKNPKFRNENGRFSPVGATQGSGTGGKIAAGGKKKGKRKPLSPEARERIAAAQRERWAKFQGKRGK